MAPPGNAITSRRQLLTSVRHLYLDDSVFDSKFVIPGVGGSLNLYDARKRALVSNFNTISVDMDSDRTVTTAEAQTPITPFARRVFKALKTGTHRVNLTHTPQHILPYSGHLLRKSLAQTVHVVTGSIDRRLRTADDQLLYTNVNQRPLAEILQGMMQYSNNCIAKQLLLTAGRSKMGLPRR